MLHQNVFLFIQGYHKDLFWAPYFSLYIYMNDISVVSSKFSFILYADDTTMISSMCMFTDTSSQEGSTMSNKINDEIVKVSDWLSHNKLSLNVSKTKFMLFHNYQKVLPDTTVPKLKIHDSEIERLTEFDFLGLTINEYLDWTSHSNKIAHKISRTLGVMNRLKHELPYNALKMIYNSLILSHMQFNITAWGYDVNRIFKLQKRALRIMTCSKYNAHTDPILKKLKLLKIQDIFNVQNLKIYYKYKIAKLPQYFMTMFTINADIHPYGTRQSSHLHHGITRTTKAMKCIRYLLPILIDNTSQDILDKVGTHSIEGFSFYVKTRTIEDYASICHIRNCYICKRDNR